MAGKGTGHHRIHGITGAVMILTMPLVIWGLINAAPGGAEGFQAWIGAPFGAVSLLAFLSAALWYCKLEFDEVILDYTDGGLRSFGLNANRLIGFAAWAAASYSILKIWLGA